MSLIARLLSVSCIASSFTAPVLAHEGMWLPTLLQAIEGNMRTEGLLISAEDIYSLNNGSLKDATVLFGGGCTAEVVSEQGLILTNHHCGFSAIANHSSVGKDYLKDGFWATTLADELPNPGTTATFIVRMEDMTDRVLASLTAGMSEEQRTAAIAVVADAVVKEANEGARYDAVLKPFNYGNSWYLIVSQTFRDVRLVGAPPGAIGNFGGDTDNWMWPRHTGDFSVFRIYADAENKPADFALTNVPFKPRRSLAVSMDGVHEGDFAMIFGFPGNTQRYLTSHGVDYVMNTGDPLKIRMRRASLAVIDEAMLADDNTRLAYANKQKGIGNAYKKWIGELRGITELRTLEGKRELESEYRERASKAGRPEFAAALDSIAAVYRTYTSLAEARDAFVEIYSVGADVFKFTKAFEAIMLPENIAKLKAEGGWETGLARFRSNAASFHANFDPQVDKRIFKAQLPIYLSSVEKEYGAILPAKFKGAESIDDLYARSVFADSSKLAAALAKWNSGPARKLMKDPAYVMARALTEGYTTRVRPSLDAANARIAVHMRTWMQGLMALFPERTFWPDANSTLRFSYGQVEGSKPRDGMAYEPFTTLDGVMEKYRPDDPEFDAPAKLIELHARMDYAPYGTDSVMPVCFTSSLHTTGGNSGSPVLNGRGELIGINFDRTWESTMSDIQFDPAKCRNISVDIRYVLFVIDKVCGAHRLIDEMKLVRHKEDPYMINLPIHR